MSLREERNEQNEQAWRAHFERERHDLSASVEAALIDDGVLTWQWQDEIGEQDASQPVTGDTERVPPRLSLQSRSLSTAQPENRSPSTTDAHQVYSSYAMEEPEMHPTPPSQQSGMLSRLARRFTSSFATVKPEAAQQQTQPYSPSSNQDRPMHYPSSIIDDGQFSAPAPQLDTPLVRVIDTGVPPEQGEERKHTESRQYRSLKRNAKIHLETTELPSIAKVEPPPQRKELETGTALFVDARDALNRQQEMALPPLLKDEFDIPPSRPLRPATPDPLSGSGTFESEQSDVMIANPCVTASSVILVTLTTNPGPVVVQYISLRPEVGFTVHLTAPVTTRTTFNYVIVMGKTV